MPIILDLSRLFSGSNKTNSLGGKYYKKRIRNAILALIISTVSKILFLFCKFFRNKSRCKKDPPLVNAYNIFCTNLAKQENTSMLTKDGKDKLKSFFRKTTTYHQSSLVYIYQKHVMSYNIIDIYTDCDDYSTIYFKKSCSANRRYAIADLENKKTEEECAKLSKMLKNAAPSYDTKTSR
ncbi:hypothetical protein [Borrelia sp. A-FGy1]|uniref:hypothetical protein n=1 Tax=Borrelia sp. A-FGy1 TaxID=2608247 RepID=UPI001E45D86F|nr:hypothetical protein [Borrelia sp. A-FGy1]